MSREDQPGASFGAGNSQFQELYDSHQEYIARRNPDSPGARQIELEVRQFKIPNLIAVMPEGLAYRRVVEIGCATGELVSNFPTSDSSVERTGLDVSPLNIKAARARFGHVTFHCLDIRDTADRFDIAILSDVLEHVPDDVAVLSAAADRASVVLVNLPLEVNWINQNRQFGVQDASGHLRAYSLASGLETARRAGLEVLRWSQVWSHESPYDELRRNLRCTCEGHAFAGSLGVRLIKAWIHGAARLVPVFGRRLYPSNLFFSARRKG